MDGIAQPRQQRSRDSFARVRSATLALLAEKGVDGVTIADVSARAQVSVGTIYGRVGNRANLLRVVQQEELERIPASLSAQLDALAGDDANSVVAIIRVYVNEMQVSTPSIRSLVAAAAEREELSEAGPESWRAVRTIMLDALAAATDTPVTPPASAWADWIFEVMEATTIQRLNALGDTGSPDELDAFAASLARTVHVLLRETEGDEPGAQAQQ